MFDRLFKRRSSGLQNEDTDDNSHAIRVTLKELIALRLQAGPLKLKHRGYSSHRLAGTHASRFKGRGMDYLESRGYQPGDDIRNMDWRITARTGQPHIKLFQEERERPVIILADFNPRMFFASRGRFKSVIASQAAALLAWSSLAHGDRTGGIIINETHREISPSGGKKGVLDFIRQLVEHSDPRAYLANRHSSDENTFNDALRRLTRMALPGTLVFILSDFYSMDDVSRKLLGQLKQRCDCCFIRISDALENTPPPAGHYAVTDGTRLSYLNTDSNAALHNYTEWFLQNRQTTEQFASRHGITLLDLTTDGDNISQLQQFLAGNTLFKQRGGR